MFRVTLICDGLPASAGGRAARDITKEFADSRQWHSRVTCEWDGTRLILRSENDFDETGQATLDELSDCIFAYIAEPGEFSIRTESVQVLRPCAGRRAWAVRRRSEHSTTMSNPDRVRWRES